MDFRRELASGTSLNAFSRSLFLPRITPKLLMSCSTNLCCCSSCSLLALLVLCEEKNYSSLTPCLFSFHLVCLSFSVSTLSPCLQVHPAVTLQRWVIYPLPCGGCGPVCVSQVGWCLSALQTAQQRSAPDTFNKQWNTELCLVRFPGDGGSRRGAARLRRKLSVGREAVSGANPWSLAPLEMLNTFTSAGCSIKAFTGE